MGRSWVTNGGLGWLCGGGVMVSVGVLAEVGGGVAGIGRGVPMIGGDVIVGTVRSGVIGVAIGSGRGVAEIIAGEDDVGAMSTSRRTCDATVFVVFVAVVGVTVVGRGVTAITLVGPVFVDVVGRGATAAGLTVGDGAGVVAVVGRSEMLTALP
jgi:hypothetical protein